LYYIQQFSYPCIRWSLRATDAVQSETKRKKKKERKKKKKKRKEVLKEMRKQGKRKKTQLGAMIYMQTTMSVGGLFVASFQLLKDKRMI